MRLSIRSLFHLFTFLLLLFLIGCNSSTEPQNTQEPETSILLNGSVNSSLDNNTTTYQGSSKIIEQNNNYRLVINISAQSDNAEKKEQVVFSINFPFTSENGQVQPGNYTIIKTGSTEIGSVDYQIVENENNFSRFIFEGDKLLLEITSSDSETITGRFSCELTSILSERMQNGIKENIQLSGKTRAEGKFNLILE